MPHRDLRDWMAHAAALGELRTMRGVHWDMQMSAVAEVFALDMPQKRPALLFDDVPGFPTGRRVLLEPLVTLSRLAMTLDFDPNLSHPEFTRTLRHALGSLKLIPPTVVVTGPVMENVVEGNDIDLLQFPAPKYHALDGGRYIGTGSVTITRDPDAGWVNLGTYRVMIHDERTLSFHVSPSHHARIQRDQLFARGERMKVAISFGHDPLLLVAGTTTVTYGTSEYDWSGGIRGEPIEVIEGPHSGLPIPATAELVIEGISEPNDERPEGPYGEWHGYYASSSHLVPTIKVTNLMYRSDPIILGVPLLRPSIAPLNFPSRIREAVVLDQLEKAGIQDVQAIHFHEAAAGTMFSIVAIKQRYAGHSRQVGRVLAQCGAAAYMGRYTIIVDDDIDIYNNDEVIWALGTRSNPETAIEILTHCLTGPLDPAIQPGPNGQKVFNTRAIIDACRPWDWRNQFPTPVETPADLLKDVRQRFGDQIGAAVHGERQTVGAAPSA